LSQLTITSNINGGRIVLNGHSEPDWVTPHTFEKVTPGTYHVAIQMDGRPTAYSEAVEVEPGIPKTYTLNMPEPTGMVHLTSDPPNLEVFIDGKPFGLSPVQKEIKIGHHVAAVKFPAGERSWLFELREGGYADHHFSSADDQASQTPMGSFAVRSLPPGATISL